MVLSFIIPLYNVKDYITECLTSIRNCSLAIEDYEIIVIDDGSSDGSMERVKTFQQQESNKGIKGSWKLIEQSNGGASKARNNGLKIAQGDYIWWIDGDDYIISSSVVTIIEAAKKHDLDVCCFRPQLLFNDNRIEDYYINSIKNNIVCTGPDFLLYVDMLPTVWSAIYKRPYLLENNLWMIEGIVHEDQEFPPKAYYLASRIMFIPLAAYVYRQREGSIMKSNNNRVKKSKDLLVVCDSLHAFVESKQMRGTKVYDVFVQKIAFAFSQSLRNFTFGKTQIIDFKAKPYYPLTIVDRMSSKEKVKYRLINSSILLYIILHKLLKWD